MWWTLCYWRERALGRWPRLMGEERAPVGGDKKPYARIKSRPPWPETIPDLERAAVYLLQQWDKPRAWGKRDTPSPTLHDNDIGFGIGMRHEAEVRKDTEVREGTEIGEDDETWAEYWEKWYLELKEERVLVHTEPSSSRYFHNPRAKRTACHELTEAGRAWAEELLADAKSGRKSWLLDWQKGSTALV
jgi:hypothetical protein